MLTADMVRARRRRGELRLVRLDGTGRRRAVQLAEALLAATRAHVGRSRDELRRALAAASAGASDRRLLEGLKKLLEDASSYEAPPASVEPAVLRREVFLEAAAARRRHRELDRGAVLAAAAERHALGAGEVDGVLYSDLRGAQVLRRLEPLSAEGLVDRYETGQAQAVLLRAVRVVADVECSSPAAYRTLFRKLKFRRLLHTIHRGERGYRIEIDGPYSLFESVTKYGLALALVLPALEACDVLRLEADVRWGRSREPLVFRLERRAGPGGIAGEDPLPDDVAALVRGFRKLGAPWSVERARDLLDLPGAGVCVPDLLFTSESGARVYLEVLGYWSREAVWRRVELAERGLPDKVLFAASRRLRVSEEVLDGVESAALYVYKGTMSPRALLVRLDRLAG